MGKRNGFIVNARLERYDGKDSSIKVPRYVTTIDDKVFIQMRRLRKFLFLRVYMVLVSKHSMAVVILKH